MSDINFRISKKVPIKQDLQYEIELLIELKRAEALLEKWLIKELNIQKSVDIMKQIYEVSDKLPINYNS